MKKTALTLFLTTLLLISVAAAAQASKNDEMGNDDSPAAAGNAANAGMAGQGTTTRQQTSPTATPQSAMGVRNQVETKNQGEDSALMVKTAEENGEKAETVQAENEEVSENDADSTVATQEKMNAVAKQVEALVNNRTIKGGIGEQVRQIAVTQKMTQTLVQAQLQKVENRSGLLKSVLGPDYKAIQNVEQQVAENQLRIAQLTQLQTQLTTQTDKAVLETTIQMLTEQNTQLEATMSKEKQTKSLFGWIFKYFAN